MAVVVIVAVTAMADVEEITAMAIIVMAVARSNAYLCAMS